MKPDDSELVALAEVERLHMDEVRRNKGIIVGATYANTALRGSSRRVKNRIVIATRTENGKAVVLYKWGLNRIRTVSADHFLDSCELVRLPTCAVPGCQRPKSTALLCNAHLLRWRSGKGLQTEQRIGEAIITRRLCDDPKSLPTTLPG